MFTGGEGNVDLRRKSKAAYRGRRYNLGLAPHAAEGDRGRSRGGCECAPGSGAARTGVAANAVGHCACRLRVAPEPEDMTVKD